MRNKFILIAFVLALLLVQFACADLVPIGEKGVHYCFKISNIDEYPDYSFILLQTGPMSKGYNSYQPINKDDCLSFYKFSRGTIAAVRKEGIKQLPPYYVSPRDYSYYNESRGEWLYDEKKAREAEMNMSNFFENSPLILKSGIDIKEKFYAPIISPVKGITDVYKIKSVSGNKINLDLDRQYSFSAFMFGIYILLFAITVLVEFIIVWAYVHKKITLTALQIFKYAALINLITFPLALIAYLTFIRNILIVELLVFIAEMFLIITFFKRGYKDSFVMSFTANLATMLMGFAFSVFLL